MATQGDWPAIWTILEPVFRAGETYAVDRDISEQAAKAVWMDAPVDTFIYVGDADEVLGTYYIKTNYSGGAAHVCNCGYVTSIAARGRGIARAMCTDSLEHAAHLGYRAMQFNLVLVSNVGAVALWQKLGFKIEGTLPAAFNHPQQGFVDAHVMWKTL
nr:N-acetyltransferase [Octadecabacter dasysiphoniae]